jgi:hypothetical protein
LGIGLAGCGHLLLLFLVYGCIASPGGIGKKNRGIGTGILPLASMYSASDVNDVFVDVVPDVAVELFPDEDMDSELLMYWYDEDVGDSEAPRLASGRLYYSAIIIYQNDIYNHYITK